MYGAEKLFRSFRKGGSGTRLTGGGMQASGIDGGGGCRNGGSRRRARRRRPPAPTRGWSRSPYGGVAARRRADAGRVAGAQPQRDASTTASPSSRRPGNLDNLRRLGDPAAGGFQGLLVRRLRHLQGARGGRLGDRPRRRRGLGRLRRRHRRAAARGPGRRRLPQLVDPGRAARAPLAGPRGEPRALLPRPPDPGRRRAGARRRARRRCSRSPAASPTSPSSGSARRAGSPVSTATRRSRRRSSSSTATPGDERYLTLAAQHGRAARPGPAPRRSTSGRSTCRTTLPVREATEPIGHAVRQLYLAAGVTDVYLENGDASLLEAMEELWRRTVTREDVRHRRRRLAPPRRGVRRSLRAAARPRLRRDLRRDRELPVELAPAPGHRPTGATRTRWSGRSTTRSPCRPSVDGCHFTYSNPLHLRAGHDGSDEDAPSERLPVVPLRLLPAEPRAPRRLAAPLRRDARRRRACSSTCSRRAASRAELPDGRPVALAVSTDYPWDGRVEIGVDGPEAEWTLSLRVPAWCEGATADRRRRAGRRGARRARLRAPAARLGRRGAGRARAADAGARRGAAPAHRRRARLRRARPRPARLLHRAGRPSGRRGGRGPARSTPPRRRRPAGANAALGVPVTLAGPRDRRWPPGATRCTRPATGRGRRRARPPTLTAIPYFRWANRGPNAMRVWIPTA